MVRAMQAYKELRDLLVKYEFVRDNGIAIVEGDYAAGVYQLGKEMMGVFQKAPSILERCGPLARTRWDSLLQRFKPLWEEMRLAVCTSDQNLRLPTWKRLLKNATGKREVTFALDEDPQTREKGQKRSQARASDDSEVQSNKKMKKTPSLSGELEVLDHLIKEAYEFCQSPSVGSPEIDSPEVLGRIQSLDHQKGVVEGLLQEETDPSLRARALRLVFEARNIQRLLQENTPPSECDEYQLSIGSSDSSNPSSRSTSSLGRPAKHLMKLPEKMQKALSTKHVSLVILQDEENRRRARDEAADLIAAVPRFSGHLTEYIPWLDAAADYIALAYGSESAKCNALKRTLEGRAEEVARTVSMGEVRSIESLIVTLHQEFGNRDVNRVKLINELKALKTPRLGHATDLRDFARVAKRVVASLQTLGALEDRLGSVYDLIRVRLPQQIHLRWMDRGEVNDVYGLLDFLETEASKLISHMGASEEPEVAGPSSKNEKTSKRSKSKTKYDKLKKSNFGKQSTAVFTATQSGGCGVCKGSCSKLVDCPRFKKMNPDERMEVAKKLKLHLLCLENHPGRKCTGERCKATSCQQKVYHHTFLHEARNLPLYKGKSNQRHEGGAAEEAQEIMPRAGNETDTPTVVLVPCDKVGDHSLFLVNVFLRGKEDGAVRRVTAVLDSGASRTFVDQTVAEELGIPMTLTWSDVSSLEGSHRTRTAFIRLQISGNRETWFDVPLCSTKQGLRIKGPVVEWTKWAKTQERFKDLGLQDVDYGNIGIILGGLEYKKFTGPPRKFVDSPCGKFTALETKLGWTVSGPLDEIQAERRTVCALGVGNSEVKDKPSREGEVTESLLAVQFRRFNDLEQLGIVRDPNPKYSWTERAEIEYLRTVVREDEGRFVIPMLWITDLSAEGNLIPPTELMARKRLYLLHKGFEKKPGELVLYQAGIEQDLKKGYIRKVDDPKELKELRNSPHFFLPHFGVRHPDKPEKLRRVVDASAKAEGKGLNDLLRRGPNFLENLLGILTRWRAAKYGMNADITEMFNQVSLPKRDQYMTAFLWNADPEKEPEVFVYTRHVFGAKCSPAVASFAVDEALRREAPELLNQLGNSFYMDDHFSSWDDVEKMKAVAEDLTKALGKKGFVLTKWQSNSKAFLKGIDQALVSPKAKDIWGPTDSPLPRTKALGVVWDCESDALGFTTRANKTVENLADVLSCLASVFDPLGIVAPFTFLGKVFLQELRVAKKSWKEPLTEEERTMFQSWIEDAERLQSLFIPRWMGTVANEKVTLHAFADASVRGLGVAVYLKAPGRESVFVAGKSRIQNPRNSPTIPRLELQACVMAKRLAESLMKELAERMEITDVFLWTDSEVTFWWVKNEDRRNDVYVSNRVYEIRSFIEEQGNKVHLRFVPTHLNPADLASRGLNAQELEEKWTFWTSGPSFLGEDESEWPPTPSRKEQRETQMRQPVAMISHEWEEIEAFTDKNWFLSQRLGSGGTPEVEKLREEETKILREIQAEQYPKVRKFLEKEEGNTGVYWGPELRGKELMLDKDGVIRMVTRMANAKFCSFDEKCPIVLPRNHPFTRLVVRDCHEKAMHLGTKGTRSFLAARYYVPRPNQTVGSIVSKCPKCLQARPKKVLAEQAALHENRLQMRTYSFASTGMDHWGPFRLKAGKRWGLILMCLTTRAVWLELVDRPDAPTFLHCLEQFGAENGYPKEFYCDNGSAFQGAETEISKMLGEPRNQKLLKAQGARQWNMKFYFNPPMAPHWGGSWERMIQEIKKIMRTVAGDVETFSDRVYRTFLKRAQFTLNNRPLEIGDDGEVLTPWQLLHPSSERSGGLPLGLSSFETLRQVARVETEFWNRWHTAYLRFLSANHPTKSKRKVDLAPGDEVVVKEQFGTQRARLVPGRVHQVYPGPDGLVRLVSVQTKTGRYLRDIRKLALAEGSALERHWEEQRAARLQPASQSNSPASDS